MTTEEQIKYSNSLKVLIEILDIKDLGLVLKYANANSKDVVGLYQIVHELVNMSLIGFMITLEKLRHNSGEKHG